MIFSSVLRKIRLALVISGLGVAAFGAASYVTIEQLAAFGEAKLSRQDKLLLLNDLDRSLVRTQVALRDYVLSGSPNDLRQFYQAANRQADALGALGDAPQLSEHDALEQLVSRRSAAQLEVVKSRERDGLAAASRLLQSDRDSYMDHLDDRLAALLTQARARERDVLWNAHALPASNWAESVVGGGAVLLLALFASLWWIVRRYERERLRVTRMLGESEAMSRALCAHMADGLITLSADLTVRSMNASALQMLGYDEPEVVGRSIAEFVGDYPGRAAFHARVLAHLADPAPFQITGADMLAVRKGGGLMPVQVSLNDVVLEGGRRLTALFRDMSGIRRATEAVQASERNLREITDTLPALVAEFDNARHCRFMNRACAEFLGVSWQSALGRRMPELLGDELYEAHAPHVQQALGGSSVSYEVTVRNAEGEMGTYAMLLVPRRTGDPGAVVGFYAFGSDITDLKRIDRLKTEFISTVSHELRTPLTSIRGSLGLISAGVLGKVPEGVAGLLTIAQNNCDRLIRLINDILDVEKIEAGQLSLRMEPVNLSNLVRRALVDNEGFALQHRVQLRMEAPPEPLMVRADADRLLQVVTNLLSNAVKFSPADATVEARLLAQGSCVRVQVVDHGAGIPPEFQQRIFRKFSQADSSATRAKGGTGLGLNISRSLVEKMGGRIGFSSTAGHGATFFFELPRYDALTPANAAVPRAVAAVPHRIRILHLEPDGDIRAIVSHLVARRAECVSAGSLQDARARLRETRFDLVLLEPELTGETGWDILLDLKGLTPQPPLVVFSASQAEPPAGYAVAASVVKSLSSDVALVQAIRSALAGAVGTAPALP